MPVGADEIKAPEAAERIVGATVPGVFRVIAEGHAVRVQAGDGSLERVFIQAPRHVQRGDRRGRAKDRGEEQPASDARFSPRCF